MQVSPLQESFSSGEISPKLYGRVSSPGYQSGLAVMNNFIADSRGPAIRRLGTQYKSTVDYNSGRIFTYPASENDYYIFVAVNLLFLPFKSTGANVTTNYTENPRFRSGSTGWTQDEVSGTITFEPDLLTLANGGAGNAKTAVGQELTLPNITDDYLVSISALTSGPYRIQIGTAFEDGSIDDRVIIGGSTAYQITVNTLTPWITVTNEESDTTMSIAAIGFLSTVDTGEIPTP